MKAIGRALLVSCSLPYPPELQTHGVFQRLNLFLEAVSSSVQRVDMLFLSPPAMASGEVAARVRTALAAKLAAEIGVTIAAVKELPARSFVRELSAGMLSVRGQSDYAPYCQAEPMAALKEALSAKPDLVFVHRLGAMIPLLQVRENLPPICFDLDDIEHRAYFRSIRTSSGWLLRKLLFVHVPALALAEIEAVRRASHTFVCSETDRRYLQRLVGRRARLTVVPNTVNLPQPTAGDHRSLAVLFVGAFSYQPNIRAADELTEVVWPLIKREVPAAELFIAGKNPEKIAAARRPGKDVHVLGYVPSLDDLYKRAAVVCCPIRSGSGTRIKIIEASAYGVPVVSTPIGAEGLAYEDGREILLRDTPAALAEACVRLLQDASLRSAVGRAARARTAALYDRSGVIEKVKGLMAGAMGAAR